jgi:CubicO group peptidase (beta-lactamase class C family)
VTVPIEVYRGLFGWDTPVRDITPLYQFPEPELTNNITVRQLMGMGTGLAESPIELYLDLTSPGNFLDTLATLPVKYPPFTAYFYNNYVYSTAAYLNFLQKGVPFAAGLEERYAREMKRELFDPMGMPTSAVTDDPRTVSSNVSRSYGYDLRFGIKPNQVLPYLSIRMVSPAGAGAMTLNDISRYLITQLNGGVTPDGRRIVARSTLAETWKGQTPMPSPPYPVGFAYGMGWIPFTSNGVQYIWHNGSVDGFKTDMTQLPQANAGILLFGNSETSEYFHNAIRGRVIELLFGLPEEAVAQQERLYRERNLTIQALRDSVTAWYVPRHEVSPFLGCYAKGWKVEYLDGLPFLTRTDGFHLVLLPTAKGYRIGSGTEGDGFGKAVAFVRDFYGQVHLRITDPADNDSLVDDLGPAPCSGQSGAKDYH